MAPKGDVTGINIMITRPHKSADEVRAAVRYAGLGSLSEARAVVLENNGEFSVVPKSDAPSDESAFFGIAMPGNSENSPDHLDADTPRASDQRVP